MANTYNFNPAPLAGQGAYGKVPGTVYLPPNKYENVADVYGGLNRLARSTGNAILDQVQGKLSPGTLSNIQNRMAHYGITSGMPGADVVRFKDPRDVGIETEKLKQAGIGNFGNWLQSMGSQMDDQGLAAMIAAWNATNQAAPNPADAANAQMEAFNRALRGATSGNPGAGWGAGRITTEYHIPDQL